MVDAGSLILNEASLMLARMALEFDKSLTPEQNIEKFHDYLASVNPAYAKLLKDQLPKLLPVPEQHQQRQAARSAFNAEVLQILDGSLEGSEK